MGRVNVIILLIVGLIVLGGCKEKTMELEMDDLSYADTGAYDNPEYLLEENPQIDMFIYDAVAYVNAADVQWVQELELNTGELIGSIKGDCESKGFEEFTATNLEVGTNIYGTIERYNILLVDIDGVYYRYLAWIEG